MMNPNISVITMNSVVTALQLPSGDKTSLGYSVLNIKNRFGIVWDSKPKCRKQPPTKAGVSYNE